MKVLIADGINKEAVNILQKDFDVVIKDNLPAAELLDIIADFDGIIIRSASKITKEVLDKAKKLKVIGRAGVGIDNIDVSAATKRGIIVLNAPEGNTTAATEHTMAMMLALSRNIPVANETMHHGEWNRKKYIGVELRGKTLGIIGLGRIGSGVAKRAMAFDMKILAYDPYLNEDRAKDLGIETTSLDNLIATADFITVHMPLTSQTKNMINKTNIAKMKKSARLFNCARGGIINEVDLAAALSSGQIAGAGIDVYVSEPLAADNPLMHAPNLILTPHLGASTIEAQIGVAKDAAIGIRAALKNEPVATAVNMAPISAQAMSRIRPYLTLAERLGCTVQSLTDGPVEKLLINYNGAIAELDTRMITIAVVKGMLSPILQTTVNYVNAPAIAKQRNIEIQEIKNKDANNFANLITVKLVTPHNEQSVQGALFGTEGRIVSINNYRVDVDPHDRILICPHINRPGMIGNVGTLLAKYNINISGMQVGKTATTGTNIMVLTIDDEISDEIIAQVEKIDGIFAAKLVDYYAI